jgi:hypothetical protein
MGPLIIHAIFSSKSEVVFFVGVFAPQMESKNYKIQRVAIEFEKTSLLILSRSKRSSFDPIFAISKFKVRLNFY